MTNVERKNALKGFFSEFCKSIDENIEKGYSSRLMYEDISRMAGIVLYAQTIGVITHKESLAYIDDIYSYRKEERLRAD